MDHATDPLEIELKLGFAGRDHAALLASSPLAGRDLRQSELVSTYYDTPEQDLRRAGVTLRVRAADGRHIQTVKTGNDAAAALFIRPEWECDLPDASPRLDMPEALGKMIPPDVLARVTPLFTTRITRAEAEIAADGATIALAVDRGVVEAGNLHEDVSELELELKSGDPAALFRLARRIDGEVPLHLGVRSKAERGYLLAEPEGAMRLKAEPVTLPDDADARDAFAAIAAAALRHYRLNEALVLRNGAVEAVHQARVAIRRLRSAMTLFRPLFAGDAAATPIADGMKRIASALGRVRDIDVLLPHVADDARGRLGEARTERLEAARALLASAKARGLLLDCVEWLAIGRWRLEPADPALASLPARAFAMEALDRQRRTLKKRSRHYADLDAHHRHKVRIAAKKLRYAIEFFAPLFSDGKAKKEARKFRGTLERLQDELGLLNDMATAPALLAELGLDEGRDPPATSPRKRIARAGQLLHALMQRKRFWRS